MDCPNNNIIKHGRNVRWAAAARILKNPARHDGVGGPKTKRHSNSTRVRSREVRDSDEGKVKRKGGGFAGAGGRGGSNPARRP
jgi:hypothetical protein